MHLVQSETRYVTAGDGTRLAWHLHEMLPHAGLGAHGVDHDAPDDRPTLLLTNGIGSSRVFWTHIVHALGRDFRVVHWDYRAHGQSALSARGDYALATQADDLHRVTRAVMDHTGGPAPVHIAFSMGVTVLFELYRTHPELFPAMVLIAGAPDAPGALSAPFTLPGVVPAMRVGMAALAPAVPAFAPVVRTFFRSRVAYPMGRALGLLRRNAPREGVRDFLEHVGAMDLRAYWETLRGLMAARGSDVLASVKIPVLIVAARYDLLMPLSQVRAMREALPHAHYVELEDAGHAGLLEAGPEVAAAIRVFLRDVVGIHKEREEHG